MQPRLTADNGVRSYLNRHPLQVACGMLLALAALLVIRFWPERAPRAFYSVDDGHTYFAHAYRAPPFEYQGREAVQALVYTCDGGKTAFVGYLMRFTPKGKSEVEERLARRSARDERSPLSLPAGEVEVKRPGSGQWVTQTTPQQIGEKMRAATLAGQDVRAARKAMDAYNDIVNVKCPQGAGTPVPVGAE